PGHATLLYRSMTGPAGGGTALKRSVSTIVPAKRRANGSWLSRAGSRNPGPRPAPNGQDGGRLSTRAIGGQILVGPRVFAAAEVGVDATPLGHLELKGFTRTIPTWP